MGNTLSGEAMPTTLTEALALDAFLEANHPDEFDEDFNENYLQNWHDIQGGKYPIRSCGEAFLLLDKLLREREHSTGDFEEKIVRQLIEFHGGVPAARGGCVEPVMEAA
jgi:hypothetical protein